MSQERPTPPSRPGRSGSEAWRTERMVQRVPAHLGETTDTISPWLMVAGIALLILIVCAVLFVLLGGGARLGIGGMSATATATRPAFTLTPAITILPVTLAAPPSPTPGPTAAIVKYKVKSGDTLSSIAAKYKVTIQSIMTANSLKDDNIRVNDDLIIPLPTPTPPPTSNLPAPGATPTPLSFISPPTNATAVATPGVIHYIVKRGDTLSSIASTFGSTIDAIRAANLLDSDLLSIGQDVLVPIGSWTPTPSPIPTSNASATPTSQFAYAAPSLLSPSNNAVFRGKQEIPNLSWTAPATLKANEYYVVHLDYQFNGASKSIVKQVKQGNSIRLDAATDYPGANPNGTSFSWYVVVVNQAAATRSAASSSSSASAQVYAASPPSATWTFVWY